MCGHTTHHRHHRWPYHEHKFDVILHLDPGGFNVKPPNNSAQRRSAIPVCVIVATAAQDYLNQPPYSEGNLTLQFSMRATPCHNSQVRCMRSPMRLFLVSM